MTPDRGTEPDFRWGVGSGEVLAVVLGLLLASNILYLNRLTIYPDGGAAFVPMQYAAASALGFLLLSSVALQRYVSGPKICRGLAVTAATGVAAFLIFDMLASWIWSPPMVPDGMDAWLVRVTGGFTAALFLAGAAVTARDRCVAALAGAAAALSLVVWLLTWRLDPLLEPVLDLWFYLTGEPVMGLPYLGLMLSAAVLFTGWWWGRQVVEFEEQPK